MRLAPRGDAHDMGDFNPLATFSYVALELGSLPGRYFASWSGSPKMDRMSFTRSK
jgi:hypothetical protein